MNRISGALQNNLKQQCCDYIKDLAGYHPMWIAGDWNRSVQSYLGTYSTILQKICSSCKINASMPQSLLCLNMTHTNCSDVDAIKIYLSNQHLPSKITQCLNSIGKKQSVVCPVYLRLDDNPENGHIFFIVFDVQQKLQILFDSDSGRTGGVVSDYDHFIHTLAKHQFHAEFTCPTLTSQVWFNNTDSIQSVTEEHMDVDEQGLCGILLLIVLLTCIRFNYYNPKHIADMIKIEVKTNGNSLITWYDHLREAISTNNTAKLQRLVYRTSSNGYCGVFNPKTGKICSRKVCKNGSCKYHCWQHRHIMLNCNSANKKCNANHVQCNHP